MVIIAFSNQKGGVGKTTSAVNTASALAEQGKTVLVIDLDPQANCTRHFGVRGSENTIYEILHGRATLSDAAMKIEYFETLRLIPSAIRLFQAENDFASEPGREYLLKEVLDQVKRIDYVIIDCAPSLGILTINALSIANYVIIPLQLHFFALEGMVQLYRAIEAVKKRLNPGVVVRILPTFYDKRTNISQEVLDQVRGHYDNQVMNTVIRQNVEIIKASAYGSPVTASAPRSAGADDYRAAGIEISSWRKRK